MEADELTMLRLLAHNQYLGQRIKGTTTKRSKDSMTDIQKEKPNSFPRSVNSPYYPFPHVEDSVSADSPSNELQRRLKHL